MTPARRKRSTARKRTTQRERALDAEERAGGAGAPRRGARKTLLEYISQLPMFLRLLGGLLLDKRVAPLDKLIVGAAIAYIVAPFDLIPDFIPFLGEVDDVYLLVLAMQRMMANAGSRVVAAHWPGSVAELRGMDLYHVLAAAAFFLPRRIRRKLRVIGRA